MKRQELKEIECIDPLDVGAKDVFDQYVAKRVPVKFTKHPSDFPKDFNWDLVCTVPDARVAIEKMDKTFGVGQFGSGLTKTIMSIQEFNDQIKSDLKFSKVYQMIQPPLTELIDCFPLKPKIIGNLVPQQYTLWVGYNTGEPVSSGLHHDFHDNLYLLISGEKQFRLYSPHDAKYMYTFGKARKIFKNGFISYVDDVRADGADLADVAKWRLKEAEIQLEKAENGHGDLNEAEQNVDDAMEELLKYSGFDDSPVCKKSKADSDREPDSFSQIRGGMSDEMLFSRFPKMQKAIYYDVTLKAGESLFMPAGWFHEVKSCGSPDSDGIHMAMNYWMAPPTETDFDHPYQDGFWDSQWKDFLKELEEFKKSKV